MQFNTFQDNFHEKIGISRRTNRLEATTTLRAVGFFAYISS